MSAIQYKRLFDLLPDLIDHEIGILGQVISVPRQANMPDFMYFKAMVSNTGVFGGEENFSVAGGTAINRDRALAKAIGEGIERYSSGIYSWEELELGSYIDFRELAIHPSNFTSFAEDQFEKADFPFSRFKEDTILRWSSAKNLDSGKEVLIPASLVYCPYIADKKNGEATIMEVISTGLASHLSYEEASLNGILETVERDSFMLAWLSGIVSDQIEPKSLLPIHTEMIFRFEKLGYQITLLNITSDTQIPSVMAVMKGKFDGSVPFLVAAATHLNPAIAIQKCLEELALIERYAKRVMMTAADWYPYISYEKVKYLVDHIRFWIDHNIFPKGDYLLQAKNKIRLEDIPDLSSTSPNKDLNLVLELIKSTGYEVLIADVTTPDIADLGFSVIRAVIPGFLPLNKSYNCRPLCSKRLLKFMEKKGRGKQVNNLPHPFA